MKITIEANDDGVLTGHARALITTIQFDDGPKHLLVGGEVFVGRDIRSAKPEGVALKVMMSGLQMIEIRGSIGPEAD